MEKSYKIEKNGIVRYKNFDSLAIAQAYADSLGTGFVVTLFGDPMPNPKRGLKQDIMFGKYLIQVFLDDNREHPSKVTLAETQVLDQKLSGLEKACIRGDLDTLQSLLPTIPTDTVFTQTRKDKYILMLESYLDSL